MNAYQALLDVYHCSTFHGSNDKELWGIPFTRIMLDYRKVEDANRKYWLENLKETNAPISNLFMFSLP